MEPSLLHQQQQRVVGGGTWGFNVGQEGEVKGVSDTDMAVKCQHDVLSIRRELPTISARTTAAAVAPSTVVEVSAAEDYYESRGRKRERGDLHDPRYTPTHRVGLPLTPGFQGVE